MEEKILTLICILSLITGTILLIIINQTQNLETSKISSLSEKEISKTVKIRGIVKSIFNKNTVAQLEVEDETGKLNIVIFQPKELTIKKESLVEAEGKVTQNNNRIELYASTIKILNQR